MPSPTRSVDLNADLGEGCPNDEALLAQITSASVSCGAHAGDRATILATLAAARRRGVVVGAHPGFADRASFGRRPQSISGANVETLVRAQVAYLGQLARELGEPVRFVKPHGALYNQAQCEPEIAAGIVAALVEDALPVLGQPGGRVQERALARGVRFVAEGFADRRYGTDGRLRPRTEPGAVLTDEGEIRDQVRRLVAEGIETICLHGDNSDSVRLAVLIRATLHDAGIAVRSFC